jgi:histidinol dehydrogenase
VLIIADKEADPVLVAADMLAQAEHDKDARARCLAPSRELAEALKAEIEKQVEALPTKAVAQASLDNGGLIVICHGVDAGARADEAVRIANAIAPEHLELQTQNAEELIPKLSNYGSLFIGEGAAEVLGDYSAGVNHTLPTNGTARYTGGLSVRHFLKVSTTLRCSDVHQKAVQEAYRAAEQIAVAEGLAGHAASARRREAV